MGFFRRARHPSAVVIDLSATRAAGAYVVYAPEGPIVCTSYETPVQPRADESLTQALARALEQLGISLIEQGAPELRRQTGSGRPDSVVVSVAAPWQNVAVRTVSMAQDKDFTITERLVEHALAEGKTHGVSRTALPDVVLASILNGYDVPNPYGMKARRAEFVVLAASIESELENLVRKQLRHLYHTHDVIFTSFAAAAYGALRHCFPHEKDYLVVDVSAHATDIGLVKGGKLVDVASQATGLDALLIAMRSAERMAPEQESPSVLGAPPGYINPMRNIQFGVRVDEARARWTEGLTMLLRTLASHQALPRTLFLLADQAALNYLKNALNSDAVHALWLSDEPIAVIGITNEQLSHSIQVRGQATPDSYLSLLALYTRTLMPATP